MDSEIALNRLETLLHAIAKLYAGVVATIMHERSSTYHAETNGGYEDDIGAALHAYIKQVKQKASSKQTSAADPSTADVSGKRGNAAVNAPTEGLQENPLSDYFKKHNAYSELAPPLGEKLKASAWEHTHNAIRFAHQGNYSSAKLHADLANNAIHELGHFMNEQDFIAFKRAVKDELLRKT